MKKAVLLLALTIACAIIGATVYYQTIAYEPLLIDDLKVAPVTLAKDIEEAKALGLFLDPYVEYDLSCPPSANFFSFVKSLPVEGLPQKKLSRSTHKELADQNKWGEIDQILESRKKLLNRFKGVTKLRPGFRSKDAYAALDFPLSAKAGLAVSLLLISAERAAHLGKHSEARELLKQAITFTNLMADQPAEIDLVLGRIEQARVLMTINRIAYRLTNTPGTIAQYEALVKDWYPKFDYARIIRFETNTNIRSLLADTRHGIYSIAKIFWKMDREVEDENGNEPPKLTREEERFLAYLTERADQEKKLMPYTFDNVSKERAAWAVVFSQVVAITKEKFKSVEHLADHSPGHTKDPVNPPTKLSEVVTSIFRSHEFAQSQERFYTCKALVLTAMKLYRNAPSGNIPSDLSGFSTPPTDFYRQPLRLQQSPKGLILLSVGRDGKADRPGQHGDDLFLPLTPPVSK